MPPNDWEHAKGIRNERKKRLEVEARDLGREEKFGCIHLLGRGQARGIYINK